MRARRAWPALRADPSARAVEWRRTARVAALLAIAGVLGSLAAPVAHADEPVADDLLPSSTTTTTTTTSTTTTTTTTPTTTPTPTTAPADTDRATTPASTTSTTTTTTTSPRLLRT